jgi:putative transposase
MPIFAKMTMRGFKFKLNPTIDQEAAFNRFSGVIRLIYNAALEQRRNWWRHYKSQSGCSISYKTQAAELTKARAEFDWISEVTQTCQQQALRDLDQAYQNFFAGRAAYPTPRCKGINDSFRFQGREVAVRKINRRWSEVKLPKLGWVKFRDTRKIEGVCKNATVSCDSLGWHISFACEIKREAVASTLPSVGIDRGVANTLALSTGEQMSLPDSLARLGKRKRRADKVRSRRKRGSKRYAKACKRAAAISAKMARIRKDWNHKASLSIAQRFGAVAIEALRISNMTASAKGDTANHGKNVAQKAGLNRSILNQGWFQFETLLAYKLEERGGDLVSVDPAYTSQTCSACGCIDKRSRESQARFVCIDCGHQEHADTNAAINIKRRANGPLLRGEDSREAA